MQTDEAIQILDTVTAQIPLVRAVQAKVIQALQCLREATTPKPSTNAPTEPPEPGKE